MAQQSARAAREHGSEQAPLGSQQRVADRVDTAVYTVQAPARHSLLDRAAAEIEGDEVAVRHEPVLPARERSDRSVTCSTFRSYTSLKVDHVGHATTTAPPSERFSDLGLRKR
jgi:hypothetical protein